MTGSTHLGSPCELHVLHAHQPIPLSFDQHHVIPQAWQLHAQGIRVGPATIAAAFPDAKLWDPRTVGVGPTCHRNVHHYIVALMKAMAREGRGKLTSEFTRVVRREVRIKGRSLHAAEFECATAALVRFEAAGHDLRALMDAGLWGVA